MRANAVPPISSRRQSFSLRSFLPNQLDRYILSEVTAPFFGGMVFFVFLFLMFQLLRLAELFIVHGVSGFVLMKMAGLLMLNFSPFALPASFLIGILVGFGRLSADSELAAMKACGVSTRRMAVPVLGLASIVVALTLALNLEWVPWGEREFKNAVVRVGNTKVVSSIKEGTFTSGFFDLLIFAEKVDVKSNKMKRVFIYDEREKNNPLTVVARTGEIVPVKTGKDLGAAAVMKLRDGSIHRNDSSGKSYQKIDFGEYRLYLKIDEGGADDTWKPVMLTLSEILKIMRQTDLTSIDGREVRGELWRRVGLAFAPVIFVFLGIGFGTVRTRAVRAGALLVAFLTLVVYWTLQTMGAMMVHRGTMPPMLAMLIPDIIFGIAAVIVFRRAAW